MQMSQSPPEPCIPNEQPPQKRDLELSSLYKIALSHFISYTKRIASAMTIPKHRIYSWYRAMVNLPRNESWFDAVYAEYLGTGTPTRANLLPNNAETFRNVQKYLWMNELVRNTIYHELVFSLRAPYWNSAPFEHRQYSEQLIYLKSVYPEMWVQYGSDEMDTLVANEVVAADEYNA